MSNYRNQLENYLKTLDIKADRVLDVGGAALPVKGRVRSWNVKEYKILDNGLEKGDCDYKYDLNLSSQGEEIMIPNIGTDIIFCLEVMEYIYNPGCAIHWLYIWLKRGGILYITFPSIYPKHQPLENDYLRYTKNGVIELLKQSGFKIIDLIPRIMTRQGFALWQAFIKAEGMHAAKNTQHDELGWIVKAEKC